MSEARRDWVLTIELSEAKTSDRSSIPLTVTHQEDLKARIARVGLPAALRVTQDVAAIQLRIDDVSQLEAWKVLQTLCNDLLVARLPGVETISLAAKVASV